MPIDLETLYMTRDNALINRKIIRLVHDAFYLVVHHCRMILIWRNLSLARLILLDAGVNLSVSLPLRGPGDFDSCRFMLALSFNTSKSRSPVTFVSSKKFIFVYLEYYSPWGRFLRIF